jgi:RNA polymerase sigma factor (sigma-70 family)
MRSSSRGHWLGITRTLSPLGAESDAELLARFMASRDEPAFETLVHRHGPMVHAVCRRRLGPGADADDAFQAAFLVFARDAAKIANPNALPGWLYRVAYLVSLKAASRKRPTDALPAEDVPMNDPPDTNALRRERDAIVDEELANLPEKFRTVLVLCLVEGKTNVEAAAALNVPVGTVDSRLHAAKRKLQDKLARRGLAVATVATLETLFESPLAATAPAIQLLIASTVRGVLSTLADSTAGALPPAVTTLAHGVSIMTVSKLKLFAIVGLGLLGGTGSGIYYASAEEKPAAKAQAEAAKPVSAIAKTADKALAITGTGLTAKTTLALERDAGLTNNLEDISVGDLLTKLGDETGATIRVDEAFFRQIGETDIYEKKVRIRIAKGLSVRDILEEVLAQIAPPGDTHLKTGLRVKGNQIILGRGSVALATPGRTTVGGEVTAMVEEKVLAEVLHGPIIGIAAENLPLSDFVNQLREQTGANIVVDSRVKEKLSQPVTLTLNDTRLMTALKIAGDAAELAPAVVDNVYYLTTKENAAKLLKETYRELYGEPQVAIPTGTVTDGVKLYEKSANLKEIPPSPLGGNGPATTIPESVAKPMEKK